MQLKASYTTLALYTTKRQPTKLLRIERPIQTNLNHHVK